MFLPPHESHRGDKANCSKTKQDFFNISQHDLSSLIGTTFPLNPIHFVGSTANNWSGLTSHIHTRQTLTLHTTK